MTRFEDADNELARVSDSSSIRNTEPTPIAYIPDMGVQHVASIAFCLTLVAPVCAQLRIVSLNASNSGSTNSGPRTGMQTILSAIGSSVSDDPTMPGNTGIAKPIDVLCLQEFRSPATTGAAYAALFNQMYGTTSFSFGTLAGATTGSGTQGIIFNRSTVELLSEGTIGSSSTTGQPREALRYKLRPVGYESGSSDFYIYNSHYKAGDDGTSRTRRLQEATAIRSDADALGRGTRIIYLGDLNTYYSQEAGYQKLLSAGDGQAFDPIGQAGTWSGNGSFKSIHTQSPFDSASGNTGFTGGGMDDRFDQQLVSGNVNDRHGFAYIPNSYQAFGNNGSHVLQQPINTGTGAAPDVLAAESSILDHLPVLADYQLPARMNVSVASVPTRVIIGANVNVQATITNIAPVQFTNGADTLDYTIAGAGNVIGTASGSNVTALSPGQAQFLPLNTSSPGISSGTMTASSSSEDVAGGTFSEAVSTTVYAHARPSFDAQSAVNIATIDFGIHGRGLGGATTSFSVSNLVDVSGFTAALDLDSIVGNGDLEQLDPNASTFSNLAAGGARTFSASLAARATGTLSATYMLQFSDEDLPGASERAPLTLVLKGIVATPGDADLNDVIDFDDYAHIDNGFNNGLQGWGNGDFDGNGVIDFDDYALIDLNFNSQRPPSVRSLPEPFAGILVLVACLSIGRHGHKAV